MDCHWVTKTHSSGVDSDCANAVCNATEVEVLRDSGGNGENVRCACKPPISNQSEIRDK